MARYLLFAGEIYYPKGGWADLIGQFDTIEQAQQAIVKWVDDEGWDMNEVGRYFWYHVVDVQERRTVRL